MTQPTQEGAVGGANDTVVAAEPTIEDRFAAFGQDEEPRKEDEEAAPAEQSSEEAPELTAEDVTEEDEAELPPIAPPVSWKAEAAEEFNKLPRALQETISQREAEREKFVQTKAQEAKQVRSQVEQQALAAIQQTADTHTKALEALRVQVPQMPSRQLQVDDPYAYAEQADAHDRAAAHNQWIEQQIVAARQTAEQAGSIQRQQEIAATQALLEDQFPEYLDPVKGPELRTKLGSTALELGYSAEQLADVNGNDILAMRRATDWRDKAAKYDKLMAQKMEKVREAKNMPRVSRPGVATAPGAVANERYTADRNAMRSGDKDAAIRVFSKFI